MKIKTLGDLRKLTKDLSEVHILSTLIMLILSLTILDIVIKIFSLVVK